MVTPPPPPLHSPAAAAVLPAAAADDDDPLSEKDKEATAATTLPTTTNPRYAQAMREGHIKGNFPSYYTFHPFLPRVIALLGAPGTPTTTLSQDHKDVLRHILRSTSEGDTSKGPLLIADWGCNSGELTEALCRRLRELLPHRKMAALGLDLDADLIKRGNDRCTTSEGGEGEGEDVSVSFAAVDLVTEWGQAEELMRAFLEKQQGAGSSGNGTGKEVAGETMGVSSSDATAVVAPPARRKFDLLTIFSTTMWIDLVHGSEALRAFLQHATEWAHCLVIEPQTPKNYKTARKRLKRVGLQPEEHFDVHATSAFAEFSMLDIKREWGFAGWKSLGKSSDWGRELYVFWEKGEEEEGCGGGGEGEEGGQGGGGEASKKREREEQDAEKGEAGQEGVGAAQDEDEEAGQMTAKARTD